MTKTNNVKISEYNWKKIKQFEGATMDDKLNTLINVVGPLMPFVEYTETGKNIKIYPSTMELLDSFRISYGESRDNIITRMLIMFDEINNMVEEWIPFKITNRYNNLLIIDGQLEVNSKEFSFNYRGNVFRGKLPPSYIVGGNDLTKALYLWYDDLDWHKIQDYILECADGAVTIEEDSFILKINSTFK